MTVHNDSFVKTERQKHFVKLAGELAEQFLKHVEFVDKEGVFPFENFQALKKAGFLSLTIPKQYGGEGI
ncbi:acyl-CoA dehydrogenase family protein [Aneurinibacillus sp. Ricciae_BoGa-3]|uniref:acyl-CoA dehydrogenase family protein n=1 Tax=Aneurinibacillus sp. Ricciae_BoGa-3 TaxID=3022697 RepID=UPI002FEE21A5